MLPAPKSFEEFWPYYVTQHRNSTSRMLHFVGTSAAMACLIVSPIYPMAALAAPFAGYGMAWIGHLVFEKNKPATWGGAQAVLWSLRGDLRMWRHIVAGTMEAELERHGDLEFAV